MLRLGHKFALSEPLKPLLKALIDEVHSKGKQYFDRLSSEEMANWNKLKKFTLREAEKLKEPKPAPLTFLLRKGIKDLKEMDVVIKQADKNLGIVPIRGDIYKHLLSEQLNSKTFRKVDNFPHEQILNRVTNIIHRSRLVPEWKAAKWIAHAISAKEPCPFYIIPKLHKAKLGTRPITAQHSYMLAPLSKALADVLQKEVEKIPEIARDSKRIMQRIEELEVQQPFVFVTYDVEQLYPSIDLADAIQVLNENIPVLKYFNNFWTRILRLIMFNNYVTAAGKTYVQLTGTATGTQVAPPFANLYLHHKFKKVLSNPGIIFQSRYIDDGLLLVKSSEIGMEVINALNKASNLRLTHDISDNKAVYLDLEVHKGIRFQMERRLDTKVYFKPTNKFLYLPFNSHHPGQHKTGIIKGEAIRCMRNCSSKSEWLKAMHLIFKGLMFRGYPPSLIKQKWKSIRYEDRDKFIFKDRENKKPERDIVLSKFHPNLKMHFKKVIRTYPVRPLLITKRLASFNMTQKDLLESFPPQIVFKDFDKLGKKLISAKQEWKYKFEREREQTKMTHEQTKNDS